MLLPVARLTRPADDVDLADLTASKPTGPARWVHDSAGVPLGLEVPFDVDPSPAETEAIVDRLSSGSSVEEQLRGRARAALADNQAFLAVASPTNAQVLAQVRALTRQNQGLIRLALRRFDGSD